MWEVFWLISNGNQVSISQALWSRHEVSRGCRQGSVYLRGLVRGAEQAKTPGVGFQLSHSSKCHLDVWTGQWLSLKMKPLIHLFIWSSKKAPVFIKHDRDSPIFGPFPLSVPLYHSVACVLSLCVSSYLITHGTFALLSNPLIQLIKAECNILLSVNLSPHCQI